MKSKSQNFSAAKSFFDWLVQHGVSSVFLAAQVRKRDGKRGAPMGVGEPGARNPVAVGPAVSASTATASVGRLAERLTRMGKKNLELITWAAEGTGGVAQSILVDDLDEVGVRVVKEKWSGPGAVLETSPGNHQMVLILPVALGREERRRVARQLIALAVGDVGAASPIQPHRFPGSVNFKMSLFEPFECRLVEFFQGVGPGVEPALATLATARFAPTAVRTLGDLPRGRSEPQPGGGDLSRSAQSFALWSLMHGRSRAETLTELARPQWLRHHDPTDWPERTVRKAESYSGRSFRS